jgi:hypothetical protein
MGANLLTFVILTAVFLVLVFWVAVRLRSPRHREEEPTAPAPPERSLADAPAPRPEIEADIVAAAETERSEAIHTETSATSAIPPEPAPESAAPVEMHPEPQPEPRAAIELKKEEEAPPALEAKEEAARQPESLSQPEAPLPQTATATRTPRKAKKRPARRKKAGSDPRQAQSLGVPAMFHDAYRSIRTWTTSLTPGRALPAILSDPQVERGNPTTFRFSLKKRPYSIVKTDLTEHDGGVGPLVHERVQLFNDKGNMLLEMALITADIGSDETPGEVTVLNEGPWLDDFRELNTLSSKDTKRIGSDFRKKFRAKEQVRLKRDFGV